MIWEVEIKKKKKPNVKKDAERYDGNRSKVFQKHNDKEILSFLSVFFFLTHVYITHQNQSWIQL